MTTVFLSGSRRLSRINEAIRQRINNMIAQSHNIIVGDANGADKAMQGYLASEGYSRVVVYYVGDLPRNNIGNWQTVQVRVPPGLTGRDFFAEKDKEMARRADVGLVLWDGQSAGSVHNIIELVRAGKNVVVYFAPGREFYNIKSVGDLIGLIERCDPKDIAAVRNKLGIGKALRVLQGGHQQSLGFI